MYFEGNVKCSLCSYETKLLATNPSEWRALKINNKIFYLCLSCQPTINPTVKDWENFYFGAVKKLQKENKIPIPFKKFAVLRDLGNRAEIIAKFNN